MRNIILSILFVSVFCLSGGNAQVVGDNPTECHAFFAANADPGNPMVIHFDDKSSGQITHWQWSFGDGNTSTQQEPVHTYLAGGTYFVCLTVSDSDSGFICHDMLCMPVTVHEPGTCVADYIYASDSLSNLTVKFTDKSTGNIHDWHWAFGDGAVSSERNPHHTYPALGKYQVCLMAYNADSMSVCNDLKCDSIDLALSGQCHADFTGGLDSLNHKPNTFRFTNISSGDPNHYRWTFDDGASYSTRDVTHQFHIEGEHRVCLSVRKEFQGVVVCVDSLCKIVKTAKYFNLGGHLFAGSQPINNPVSTGDTGLAYLFRKEGSRLIPYDTTFFTNLGYFAFPAILNGSYIVKAALTPWSAHYTNYFPAYFPQALRWQDAVPLNLTDSNSYSSNIAMVPMLENLPGPGAINGKVEKAGSMGNNGEIPSAEVVLYNSQLNPIRFTLSGQSGSFEINNLPYGDYYVYVESPGQFSRLTPAWLNASRPTADSMRLEVFPYDVTGISDPSDHPGFAGELYPNPATSSVSLVIHSPEGMSLLYEIRTMTGQVAGSGTMVCRSGSAMITIPVGSLPGGIYAFTVIEANGQWILTKKLIKY